LSTATNVLHHVLPGSYQRIIAVRESERRMERMKPDMHVRRMLWSVVILLAVIGIAIVVRRTTNLVPILINGYNPPAAASNPTAAQFAALDAVFARYPILTLVHILPGLLFMVLGPLQFSSTIRTRHLQWHRSNEEELTRGIRKHARRRHPPDAPAENAGSHPA